MNRDKLDLLFDILLFIALTVGIISGIIYIVNAIS